MPTQKHLQAFVYTPDKYNMVDMFAGRARLTRLSPSMGTAHAHWISAVMSRTTLVWWVYDKFTHRLAPESHPTAS